MDEITLTSAEFKALASDTRTGIIKILGNRNHTLSELSKKMSLAAPTVKQHLSVLEQAGLVACIDEGRKWKYYSLTKKGKKIVQPETPTSVLIVLALSALGMLAVLYAILSSTVWQIPQYAAVAKNAMENAPADKLLSAAGSETAKPAAEALQGVAPAANIAPLAIAAVVLIAIAAILFVKIFRKR